MKIRRRKKINNIILKSSMKPLLSRPNIGEKVIAQAFADNMIKDNALRKKNKAPIAKYDLDTQRAYLEYPDGRRVYSD